MQIKFWYLLSLGIIGVDILLKILTDGLNLSILGGVLSFTSVHNTGASWGLFSGAQVIFIVLGLIAVAGMILFDILYKKPFKTNGWYKVGFTCLIGGIIGNLIDRLFLGYVRDFISLDFISFPVFNIADIALTVGCICIAVYIIFFAFVGESPKNEDKTVKFERKVTKNEDKTAKNDNKENN